MVSEDVAMIIPATLMQETKSGSFPWLFWILVVLALLAALAVAFMVWRKKQPESKKDSTEDATGTDVRRKENTEGLPPRREDNAAAAHRRRKWTEFDEGRQEQSGPAPDTLGLKIIAGPLTGRRVEIGAYPFRIGASRDNDLPIPDDDRISGHHAHIHRKSGRMSVQDVGSKNGTFVNGEKIDAVQTLQVGDVITVGGSELELVAGAQHARSAEPVR
jgi:hypothetical protein